MVYGMLMNKSPATPSKIRLSEISTDPMSEVGRWDPVQKQWSNPLEVFGNPTHFYHMSTLLGAIDELGLPVPFVYRQAGEGFCAEWDIGQWSISVDTGDEFFSAHALHLGSDAVVSDLLPVTSFDEMKWSLSQFWDKMDLSNPSE